MGRVLGWLAFIVILAACTCGVRPECPNRAQISILAAVHDDPTCKKVSPKGVLISEAAKYLADAHNNKSNGIKIETAVMDTCGSLTGAVKSAMKALVWADINCLHPPSYLGIIGPDSPSNTEAVHKITSVLGIPHIVKKALNSPYLHHLPKESDGFIAQGILKVLETLRWKSFTLVADGDDDNEDDVQNVAKKVTSGAIAKKLCVKVHDDDDNDADLSSQIVHIGRPNDDFFRTVSNATIVIASEGRLEDHINAVTTNSTIILLEDGRNDFGDLETKVEKSRWWNGEEGKYDAEELREVRWLENAIKIYTKALDLLCKKKKCKNQVNPSDWNNVVTSTLASRAAEIQTASRTLDMSIKARGSGSTLDNLGHVSVLKNHAEIHWKEAQSEESDEEEDTDFLPSSVEAILSKEKSKQSGGCATATKQKIKMTHPNNDDDDDDEDEAARVLLMEMDDSEWWTMVGTVSGVGVAMFAVGILAVYVVYSNIRGPRTPKSKGRGIERDTSLRRVGSDRDPTPPARTQRNTRGPQRMDSNRSIRSNISDRSV